MEEFKLFLTLAALIVSILSLYLHFRKPKLKVRYEDKSPYKKLSMVKSDSRPYPLEIFIRVKVNNSRKKIAKKCFGKITDWYTNGKKVDEFDPIKLHWVSNDLSDYSPIDLAKDEYEYLDIIKTNREQAKLLIYTNTHPRGTPLSFSDKDEHLFRLSIYCENETSTSKWFVLSYTGDRNTGDLTWISMKQSDKKIKD